MQCEKPKFAYWNYFNKIDEKTGEVYKSKELKFSYDLPDEKLLKYGVYIIPCGKCLSCQISKSNEYAVRAYLESKQYKNNCFVTLTYNNEKIPKNRSLIKRDLQLFWKRLRKSLGGVKIRYLACGEYGPCTLRRPHYHAIIFNYKPDDLEYFKKSDNYEGNLFTSKKIEKIWGNGFVLIGNVTFESAAYVARYVTKKAYGLDKNWNKKHNREPEFTLSSRRGGLAENAIKNKQEFEKIKRNKGVLVKTKDGVKKFPIPLYLRNKWRKIERETYFKLLDTHAHANLERYARTRAENSKNNYTLLAEKIQKSKEIAKKLDKRNDL